VLDEGGSDKGAEAHAEFGKKSDVGNRSAQE
jgi:hypothetical protein